MKRMIYPVVIALLNIIIYIWTKSPKLFLISGISTYIITVILDKIFPRLRFFKQSESANHFYYQIIIGLIFLGIAIIL